MAKIEYTKTKPVPALRDRKSSFFYRIGDAPVTPQTNFFLAVYDQMEKRLFHVNLACGSNAWGIPDDAVELVPGDKIIITV